MLCAADRRVLLLDHTKMPRTAPHLLCDVSAVDVVVVDSAVAEQQLAMLRATGVTVLVADGGRSEDAVVSTRTRT
jgi:DeoR/GlpR family transcriptional regulator of sugar metabolism